LNCPFGITALPALRSWFLRSRFLSSLGEGGWRRRIAKGGAKRSGVEGSGLHTRYASRNTTYEIAWRELGVLGLIMQRGLFGQMVGTPQTRKRFVERLTRLYEQGASVERIGDYVRRWQLWAVSGLGAYRDSISNLVPNAGGPSA